MVFGVDFGASVTDAVALGFGAETASAATTMQAAQQAAQRAGGRATGNDAGALLGRPEVLAAAALSRPGPASVAVLESVLERLEASLGEPGGAGTPREKQRTVGVTGGRARSLPARHGQLELVQVGEPEAVMRGALHLAGLPGGMAVSCGSGTVMVLGERNGPFKHVTGTPVGGGTLQAFGRLLFDGSDADEVAALALEGDAAGVDTTLADVLGGSLGELPASATAVSLGRLGAASGTLDELPAPADLAAGLCTMVAQTIALIALNAAFANGSPPLVFVGRVARYPYIADMIAAVLRIYRYPHEAAFPAGGEKATAIGAAVAASSSRAERGRPTG